MMPMKMGQPSSRMHVFCASKESMLYLRLIDALKKRIPYSFGGCADSENAMIGGLSSWVISCGERHTQAFGPFQVEDAFGVRCE